LLFPFNMDDSADASHATTVPSGESKGRIRERLMSLMTGDLQEMIPPRQAPNVSSHGTGLYLANLAAAVVGWRLVALAARMSSGSGGQLAFLLYHVPVRRAPPRKDS